MTPDWIGRLVPPGLSRGKLLAVGGLLVTALGVAAYDLAWLSEDDPLAHAGVEAMPDAQHDVRTPAATPPAIGDAAAPAQAAAAATTASAMSATSASSGPTAALVTTSQPGSNGTPDAETATAAGSGSQPDWGALFAQLMERESSTVSSGGLSVEAVLPDSELQTLLSGFQLRGLIHDDTGGLALINGRLLRAGDVLPGTTLTVTSILQDRILLRSPERASLVPLLLEPMHGDAPGAR